MFIEFSIYNYWIWIFLKRKKHWIWIFFRKKHWIWIEQEALNLLEQQAKKSKE